MPEPGSTCSSQPAGNGSPCWGGSSSLGSSHGSDPGPTRAGYMSVLWLRRQRGGKCAMATQSFPPFGECVRRGPRERLNF
jgi:hypothetical protein